MKKVWIFSFLTFIVLAGCSKPSTQHDPTFSQKNEPAPLSPEAITSLDENSYSSVLHRLQRKWEKTMDSRPYSGNRGMSYRSYWCAPESDCQGKMVMLILELEDGRRFDCTGVLVKSDVVLTNFHCIEPLNLESNAPMKSGTQILVIHPSSSMASTDSETRWVSKLIGSGPREFTANGVRPDFAFLLLDRPMKVKPARLSSKGIVDGESYTVWTSSPYADTEANAIESRECQAKFNTTFSPSFDSSLDPIIMFAHCPIGPGNSGAPIYNKDGELVGLIGGQINPEGVRIFNDIARDTLKIITDNTTLGQIGWGTNAACIPDINNLSQPIPEACNTDFEEPKAFVPVPSHIENKILGRFNLMSVDDSTFEHQIQRANTSAGDMILQSIYFRVPKCIRPEALISMSGMQNLTVSSYYVGLLLSSHWELTTELTEVMQIPLTYSFDASNLKNSKLTELRAVFAHLGPGNGWQVYKGHLTICSN